MLNDSFASESLITECVLSSNEISYSLKSLIDIEAADYSFIDEVIAQIVCDQLQIELLTLIKAKSIREFDDHYAKKLITHAIYSNLTVQDHTIDTASMLIIRLCYDSSYAPSLIVMLMTMLMTMCYERIKAD